MELALFPIATGIAAYQLVFWLLGFALLVWGVYRVYLVIREIGENNIPTLRSGLVTIMILAASLTAFAFTSSQRAPKLELQPRVNNERTIEDREIITPEPRTERLDGFRPLGE